MSAPLDMEQLTAVIDEMRKEQAEFRAELKKNSELTGKINSMTEEMVDLFAAAKGAFKVLGWIGVAIKWTAGLAAAIAGIYAFFYTIMHGFPPK